MKRIFTSILIFTSVIGFGQDLKVKRTRKVRNIQSENIQKDKSQVISAPVLKSASSSTSILVRGKALAVVENGNEKQIQPLGDVFYIWPSLSPEGDKILFTAAGKGSFICNLEGEIISELGYINAPVWMNNDWIAGMKDLDDGHTIQSSNVVAIHVNTVESVNISESDIVAQYPVFDDAKSWMYYNNIQGEVFKTKIKITK